MSAGDEFSHGEPRSEGDLPAPFRPQPVPVVPQPAPAMRPGPGFPFAYWRFGSQERPKQERDSLRSRSKEGRPGSRKHRRYVHSVDLVNSLRRMMVARGEENLPSDVDAVEEERVQARPSVFYRLLESEGADALETWAAAEAAAFARAKRGRSPHTRHAQGNSAKDAAWLADERVRQVRRTFRENWQFLSTSESSQELIAKLEGVADVAFGSRSNSEDWLQWQLFWTGEDLATKAGAPPAHEMQLEGLDAAERKVVHQLARLIGLHSESRLSREMQDADKAEKVMSLRPHRSCRTGGIWAAPFSVSQVLKA
ncbi:unnamed protein product [Effrenium voratum]|uniref:R3H domain-containing protein n=1 Tax=Effrenium voratum TaxID=2562239 RepID=A0AA36J1M6_9DINO|nr:unnamed protein product [Effrenium voratum]CAJ1418424.1 unnamed protein product [Effrenium voratum]|mmetsp:Transcript_114270/g.271997  ORF Transcript_114270/g.271997 Transcript_114270/m.271997 type:complete len:311 (+) Transcript_114270:95-1027(+)